MEPRDVERRLTTILSADVVGYSRLMGKDEAGTLAALKVHRKELIEPKASQYHGRTVKLMGDGALMEFTSVVDAVLFAVEIQCAMRERNVGIPPDKQILYRMGINIGDVIVEGDDIFGDGVNVAARLEGLAEPGGICVSRTVHNQVKPKIDLTFEDLGEKKVKNIAAPISVYRVLIDHAANALTTPVRRVANHRPLQWPLAAMAAAVLLALISGVVWLWPWEPNVLLESNEKTALHLLDRPSIAVLPFDNMSDDPDLDYFNVGITEDIISGLSANPELRVIARSSSFAYKGRTTKVQDIAKELDVRFILEGSVRKIADRVRITAQLIDAATGQHVWAQQFDKEGTDVFALQDDVTAQIIGTLGGPEGRIKKSLQESTWNKGRINLDEYDYYLRGHAIFFRGTKEAMLEARRIWQEGLGRFPGSGLLLVKIAWTHYRAVQDGWTEDRGRDLEEAFRLAQEGLSDPNIPVVGQWYGRWVLALTFARLRGDLHKALEQAEQALALAPRDSWTLVHLSEVYLWSGQVDRALKMHRTAVEHDPHFGRWFYRYFGWASSLEGRCDEAIDHLSKLTWSNLDALRIRASCYARLGLSEKARATVGEMLEMDPQVSLARLREELPYRNAADLERELTDLRSAGLPE